MPANATKRLGFRLVPAVVALLGIIGPAARPADAFPEPAIVPTAWRLEFAHADPDTVVVRDADGSLTRYWYMTYKVVNTTGADRLFTPEITVYTDTGRIIQTGFDVPTAVLNAIRQRTGNRLLVHPADVVDVLRQGPDHAVESFALWQQPDDDVDHLTIFFSGLSGETQQIPHPVTGEPVLLRKTLMIDYQLPGTGPEAQGRPVLKKNQQWVMR